MEILQVITKEVFEAHVPAAKMPERNTSVFERMSENIRIAYSSVAEGIVGWELIPTAEENASIREEMIRCVCIHAFVMTMRSLDLVLTATGFGIVSTNTTAPASAARVKALEEEQRLQLLLACERLIEMLIKVEGWGKTVAARSNIQILFYRPELMRRYCMEALTAENWHKVSAQAFTFDAYLRATISTEYMDELLVKLRTASLTNDDIIVMDMCNRLTATGIAIDNREYHAALSAQREAIVQHMEKNIDRYPIYLSSTVYAKRHEEKYQNRKEDPSFFFMS